MIKFHSTVIFVRDIVRSKIFYTSVLNFEIEHDFGNNVILTNGLSIWQPGQNHPVNSRLTLDVDSTKFELYFESDNLESIYKKLKAENLNFFQEIHEEPWGQQTMRFFDPDSHLIEIGEPLEVFIRRMHVNGLSEKQVSDKSGVPIETVKRLLAE